MATILFTWELGGGLGHTTIALPVLQGLRAKGHRVVAAVKHDHHAERMFEEQGLTCLRAPIPVATPAPPLDSSRTFAHVLHDHGWLEPEALRTMADCWRALLDHVRPDLILFDHSPTALLAARASTARRSA